MNKPIYENDKSAPRMKKGQFSNQVITKELWRDFRKKFPEYKNKTDKELNNIWQDLAKKMREEIVSNPLGVKLGSYTGELKLQYLPHKFKSPDIVSSNELGEKVTQLNITTRGKVAKLKWERRWAVKFNRMLQFFAFQPTRELTQMSKKYTDENAERLRMSRNTLGGLHIWTQINKQRTNGEKEVIKKVVEMMRSDDREMVSLGHSIYLESNPTDSDVEEINETLGWPPIMNRRIKEQIEELIETFDNGEHARIF